MDVKAEVKADLTPAVKAGSGIATNTHKGISKLFYALCGPWMEGRVRKAELIAAQTSKDCADIKNGLATYVGENVIPFEPQATVASSFEALHKLNHASDAKRLHVAMQEAARQISEVPEEQISDEPLSQDFFNHWRREAEMIDDEVLRKWWASLLVEEAKTPKSISPRTLDVARNMSKGDALIFQRMSKGGIGRLIPINHDGHPQYINYAEALMMQDAGLLVASRSIQTLNSIDTATGQKSIVIPVENAKCVLCVDGDRIKISGYFLSAAGIQLANVLYPNRTIHDSVEIAEFLWGMHKDRTFSIHEMTSWQGGQTSWKILPLWISDVRRLPKFPTQGVTK